jgi:CTP:molybdopterin cytidylyltransferase MocA
MNSPGQVHAVLLAAGHGRRLGFPKAALKLNGVWMLPELIRNLKQGGAAQVSVVLSPPALDAIADLGLPGADFEVQNPAPDSGRTGSILRGLHYFKPGQAALIHACDIPLLQAAVVARLIKAWRNLPNPDGMMARPISSGGRGGHPLLIGSELLEILKGFQADQSLRDLLHHHRDRLLDVKIADDPGPFLDVDTPEQLSLLESLLTNDA